MDDKNKEKVFREAFLKEMNEEQDLYRFFNKDIKRKYTGNPHEGYSVMLFGNESGKLVREGDLMSSFFEKYNKIKHQYNINIGWELINKHFYKD